MAGSFGKLFGRQLLEAILLKIFVGNLADSFRRLLVWQFWMAICPEVLDGYLVGIAVLDGYLTGSVGSLFCWQFWEAI